LVKVAFSLPWIVDVWDIPLRYVGSDRIKLLKNRLSKLLFRDLYRWADLFIVGIRPDRGFRYFRVPHEKILQWQTTIRLPEHQPAYAPKDASAPFQLLCMRSNHNKDMGLDILGAAFGILEKNIPHVRLWIVGKIDEDVEQSVTTLRASKRVTFTGFMNHAELMKLIAEVDCCVIPWRDVEDLAQTYPTKVMEYLTQGKVLVAARLQGISEMITDGYNGLLFAPGNHRELADKIEALARDEGLRKYISSNAALYNEKFDGELKNQCIMERLIKICDDKRASAVPVREDVPDEKLNVVFICSGNPRPGDRNMNYFQRAHYLSRQTNLTILAAHTADFASAVMTGTTVLNSPWHGKGGMILHCLSYFLARRGPRRNVMVITEPSLLGACGYIAKMLTGCRWVVDVWDIPLRFDPSGRGIGRRIYVSLVRRLMKYLYRSADRFIVSIVPDLELRNFDIPAEKMDLYCNAVWQEDGSGRSVAHHDPHAVLSILCMRSSYSKHMGLDTLAEAFMAVKDTVPGLVLNIIGRIPSDVRGQVRMLEGCDQVRFLDHVEHEMLLEMIRGATICVVPFKDVPDLAQTYPVKVVEYLSLGRPLVASDIEGIRRMVADGVNALLFRAGDAHDLAEKMLLLLRDVRLRTELACNAARYEERFDCRAKNQAIIFSLRQLADAPLDGQFRMGKSVA
jgi:glycosyltransferase involved in cell wall biosynthesis